LQRRRLSDVLGVLSAIGCCERRSQVTLHWFGLSRIPSVLGALQLSAKANLPEATLDSIIGNHRRVAIASLTVQVVMCFLSLQLQTLDVRQISRYLSRASQRHKSTLCKVYQVVQILEAAEIVSRSEIPGQLTIAARFFNLVPITDSGPAITPENLYSIKSLLAYPHESVKEVLQSRRRDFFAAVERQAAIWD
jgi:hypothetical protein